MSILRLHPVEVLLGHDLAAVHDEKSIGIGRRIHLGNAHSRLGDRIDERNAAEIAQRVAQLRDRTLAPIDGRARKDAAGVLVGPVVSRTPVPIADVDVRVDAVVSGSHRQVGRMQRDRCNDSKECRLPVQYA